MTNPEQRRLRRSVALHVLAVAVFAMLALSGAGAAAQGLYGLAVPFILTGIAGGLGAAVIAVTVWRGEAGGPASARDRAEADAPHTNVRNRRAPDDAATTTKRSKPPQRTTRLAMTAAAVVVLIAGVTLAPQGTDRGFVIAVAVLLAAALALFALLAGDRSRTAPSPTRNPH